MSFDGIAIRPVWSWPLVAAVAAGLVLVVLLTYPQRVRHLSPGWRRTLLGLRLTAAIVLALALLRPEIHFRGEDDSEAALVVLVDRSRSTQTLDAPGGRPRREAMLRTLRDNQELFAELGEDHEIRWYDFAAELEPIPSLDAFEPEAEGGQTAIGHVLETLEREARGRRVAAVLFFSDGAQRATGELDVDARAAARALGLKRIPVYTVGYGGSGLSQTMDLSVEDLELDSLVFEKKMVAVGARLRVTGAAGRNLEVRLLVVDRTGKKPGEAGEMKVPSAERGAQPTASLRPERDGQVLPVELSYVPRVPGEFKIAVEVVPVEGELKRHNNQKSTIISVQKGGINIAYFDHPLRPEQKFLREVNTTDKIQLDYIAVPSGLFRPQSGVVSELFEPGRYDAYIIGDVPASAFAPQGAPPEEVARSANLKALAERIDEGVGLLMLGGYHSFSPGGYARTPLGPLFPVVMNPLEVQRGPAIDESLHYLQKLQMVPTQQGLDHFIMRLAPPAENRERWLSLAPMEGANRLKPKNDAVEVLAETGGVERIPLLFTHEPGRARVMAFAANSTWLWQLAGQDDAHQRFWQQMILYLVRKEQDTDAAVWARVEPRTFTPEQDVTIAMGARNDEGDPVTDARFEVQVLLPNDETSQPAARQEGDEHVAGFTRTAEPGDYWVRVSATKDGMSLGPDAWTRFVVDDRDLELDNPAADDALLAAIAEQSGGRRLQPEELTEFLEHLKAGGLAGADLTRPQTTRLWDNWGFLAVFVGLMTLEWFLRKRRGLV
ncbi:MAG: glutamine amidotransferase [Planctomycetes bacterium]|nr:glutamine amidotransferase [Planctomycetota bacterium]